MEGRSRPILKRDWESLGFIPRVVHITPSSAKNVSAPVLSGTAAAAEEDPKALVLILHVGLIKQSLTPLEGGENGEKPLKDKGIREMGEDSLLSWSIEEHLW